jgi:photosystem II stability/assembly factor-like uncharacterized protein
MAVDPNGFVFAGGPVTIQATSTAGGPSATWNDLTRAMGLFPGVAGIQAIVIDPITPANVYVLSATSAGAVLEKSADHGVTWSTLSVPIDPNYVAGALAIDPVTPTNLYLATGANGAVPGDPFVNQLWKSADGGATWTALNPSVTGYLRGFAVDPAVPTTLFLEMSLVNNGNAPVTPGGLWRSTDGGQTFAAIATASALGGDTWYLTVDPRGSATALYAGVFTGAAVILTKSVDGGATWTVLNFGSVAEDLGAIVVDPATPSTIYVTCSIDPPTGSTQPNFAVVKSKDGGATWISIANGLGGFAPLPAGFVPPAPSLAIDPAAPKTIYVGFPAATNAPAGTPSTLSMSVTGGE